MTTTTQVSPKVEMSGRTTSRSLLRGARGDHDQLQIKKFVVRSNSTKAKTSDGRNLQACSTVTSFNTTFSFEKPQLPFKGLFFDIFTGPQDIELLTIELDVDLSRLTDRTIRVYYIEDTFVGFTGDRVRWLPLAKTEGVIAPEGAGLIVPQSEFTTLRIPSRQRRGIYISMNQEVIDYKAEAFQRTGSTSDRTAELTVFVGSGTQEEFPDEVFASISPQFAGVFHYATAGTCSETKSETGVVLEFLISSSTSQSNARSVSDVIDQDVMGLLLKEPIFMEYAEEYEFTRGRNATTETIFYNGGCPPDWALCPQTAFSSTLRFRHDNRLQSGTVSFHVLQYSQSISDSIRRVLKEKMDQEVQILYVGERPVRALFEMEFESLQSSPPPTEQDISYFELVSKLFLQERIAATTADITIFSFEADESLDPWDEEAPKPLFRGEILASQSPAGTAGTFRNRVRNIYRGERDQALNFLKFGFPRPTALVDASSARSEYFLNATRINPTFTEGTTQTKSLGAGEDSGGIGGGAVGGDPIFLAAVAVGGLVGALCLLFCVMGLNNRRNDRAEMEEYRAKRRRWSIARRKHEAEVRQHRRHGENDRDEEEGSHPPPTQVSSSLDDSEKAGSGGNGTREITPLANIEENDVMFADEHDPEEQESAEVYQSATSQGNIEVPDEPNPWGGATETEEVAEVVPDVTLESGRVENNSTFSEKRAGPNKESQAVNVEREKSVPERARKTGFSGLATLLHRQPAESKGQDRGYLSADDAPLPPRRKAVRSRSEEELKGDNSHSADPLPPRGNALRSRSGDDIKAGSSHSADPVPPRGNALRSRSGDDIKAGSSHSADPMRPRGNALRSGSGDDIKAGSSHSADPVPPRGNALRSRSDDDIKSVSSHSTRSRRPGPTRGLSHDGTTMRQALTRSDSGRSKASTRSARSTASRSRSTSRSPDPDREEVRHGRRRYEDDAGSTADDDSKESGDDRHERTRRAPPRTRSHDASADGEGRGRETHRTQRPQLRRTRSHGVSHPRREGPVGERGRETNRVARPPLRRSKSQDVSDVRRPARDGPGGDNERPRRPQMRRARSHEAESKRAVMADEDDGPDVDRGREPHRLRRPPMRRSKSQDDSEMRRFSRDDEDEDDRPSGERGRAMDRPRRPPRRTRSHDASGDDLVPGHSGRGGERGRDLDRPRRPPPRSRSHGVLARRPIDDEDRPHRRPRPPPGNEGPGGPRSAPGHQASAGLRAPTSQRSEHADRGNPVASGSRVRDLAAKLEAGRRRNPDTTPSDYRSHDGLRRGRRPDPSEQTRRARSVDPDRARRARDPYDNNHERPHRRPHPPTADSDE